MFITAVCRERFPYLHSSSSKKLLLDIMREVKHETGTTVMAYVILDEHFHWLLNTQLQDISGVMQSVKLRFTRRFAASNAKPVGGSCWQPRFWDHVIRNQQDFNRHLDYIHYNPIKHEYVQRPIDFEFSSFSAYMKKNCYEADRGGRIEPESTGGMVFE